MMHRWTLGNLAELGLIAAMAFLFACTAIADPNDLTGGVLIAHYCPECLSLTTAPPGGPCGAYEEYPIGSLGEVLAQVNYSPFGQLWYVLAAWEIEDKTWCGTEFGLGAYDPSLYVFTAYAPCFPVAGLEIPTPGWPGPNEGTAFVTTGTPWSGNWVQVYFFYGYAYPPSYGSTVMPIDVDPQTGFCGFSNCLTPPQLFDVDPEQRGAMGVNDAGYVPVWPVPPPQWACCLPDPPGTCEMLTEQACLQAGGTWLGEGFTCEPVNPCPPPGACCIIGECFIVMEEECTQVGGTFYGPGSTCDPDPCVGVCCYEAPGTPHACEILHRAECNAISGYWHPEWTTCDPNPCVIYTPIDETSWGKIKSMYR